MKTTTENKMKLISFIKNPSNTWPGPCPLSWTKSGSTSWAESEIELLIEFESKIKLWS